jgi:hypothetical protein
METGTSTQFSTTPPPTPAMFHKQIFCYFKSKLRIKLSCYCTGEYDLYKTLGLLNKQTAWEELAKKYKLIIIKCSYPL